jgi:dienelactone hydrolase
VRHGGVAACIGIAIAALAPATPFGLGSCADVQGVHQCSGLVSTWDGVPLDTTVTLPSAGAARLPLVVLIHGFGNSKYEYLDPASSAYTGNAFEWARDGYAVLTYTARGLWGSCGAAESRAANPGPCARGWIHLADHRFEVRDTQELVGRLVDEGIADPHRIGVTGDSYGGGQSFALAALRDRVMAPDGSLVAWRSPGGTPLSVAAAAPVIPWTDLLGAIAPNGRELTYGVTPQGATIAPVGVFKISFAHGILAAAQFATGPGQPVGEPFIPGRSMGYLAPAGADPEADVAGWVARADQGEPYTDESARRVVSILDRYHSAYGIDSSREPPALFVASGFTDDLFPVDEALRFVHRTARRHPHTPMAVMLGDFGHQRASQKQAERDRLVRAIRAWFGEHLRDGPAAPRGVTATTQTCPREAPAEGPFAAPTFGQLARGEVRFGDARAQAVRSDGGDPSVGAAVDPVAGGGDACATTPAGDLPGTATYRLPAAPEGGYTLLGAPTVIGRLRVSGDPEVQQVATRLWDVGPDGDRQTLVARGLYRPTGDGEQVWQTHPNGWTFAAGHVPKLELLGADPPYGRASRDSFSIEVERVELRLPVRELPDCRVVMPALAPVLPPGQKRAPGVATRAARGCGGAGAQGGHLRLRRRCKRGSMRATVTARGARIRRVYFYAGGRRVARDARAPFTRRVVGGASTKRRVRITARAALAGLPGERVTRTARRCGRGR